MATSRITGKDIRIEFIPTYNGVAATHVQKLAFEALVSAGTFKLRVNGILTAAITYSDTIGTLLTNINAALDAAIGAGLLVATGTVSTEVTLTGASTALTRFFIITFEEVALTGGSSDPVETDIVTQGGELITLSAETSSFSTDTKTDTVDVTAISEYEENKIAVKETMTFEFSLFNAQQTWLYIVRSPNLVGKFIVYPTGKFVGNRYGAFLGLIEDYKEDFPDHEKVEISLSGSRVGAMITPFESIYA